jgi:hypothetical protein
VKVVGGDGAVAVAAIDRIGEVTVTGHGRAGSNAARVERRRAVVVAPAAIGRELARALAHASRDGAAPELEVEVAQLGRGSGPRADPFGLRALLPSVASATGAEVVLVVVPRRRGLARSVPGFVAAADGAGGAGLSASAAGAGRPVVVGVVQADGPDELGPWLDAIRARRRAAGVGAQRVVVGAMGKDRYLDTAGSWVGELEAAGVAVDDLRADRVRREVLCEALAAGPAVAAYLGHGGDTGWGGYQTVRWRHVDAVTPRAPAGFVVGLACSTLRRTRGVVPFGSRLVASGRACAYLGSVRQLANDDVERLGSAIVAELAAGRHADVASLLATVATTATPELAAVLDAFRLVGDPWTPLPGPVSGGSPSAPSRGSHPGRGGA